VDSIFTHLTAQLSGSPLHALTLVYLGGVLASLTPCIYPMIPITIAIVGGESVAPGEGARSSRWRPIWLTLLYVLGLSLVYSVLGLVAGLSGTLFGSISSNPWMYFAIANVLIIAALAMLDVLPVRLPASLLAKATSVGSAGRASGAFGMGAMSGLVAAPCSAPVMAAVLTWVTTTKSGPLGFLYLFVFSLGMCTLLIIVGFSSGTLARLPRSGVWMLWVKRFVALVMIGVAEYYLIKMGQFFI
jgi:cytochrome c-type biogenesis protein